MNFKFQGILNEVDFTMIYFLIKLLTERTMHIHWTSICQVARAWVYLCVCVWSNEMISQGESIKYSMYM